MMPQPIVQVNEIPEISDNFQKFRQPIQSSQQSSPQSRSNTMPQPNVQVNEHLALDSSNKNLLSAINLSQRDNDFNNLQNLLNKILANNPTETEYLKSLLSEILDAVPRGILSAFQVRILFLKLLGFTIRSISGKLEINSFGSIETIIQRTACGRAWHPNMKGGGTTILSQLDEELFLKNVIDRAEDINCISTHAARLLAFHLQKARIKKAKEILFLCKCPQLAEKLKVIIPDSSWLKKAARKMGINVVPKQTIEEARRRCCDKFMINLFFDKHGKLLDRSPLLIFNMDETMISSNKKLKILCPKDCSGLSVAEQTYPHITACITIGAKGIFMKPLIILPNKRTIKGLEEFTPNYHIASSLSGWMNKKIFTFWALCFLSEIMRYRLDLPENLKEERILLILDGHTSRANFFVAKIFDVFGIDILVLPGHTTHLLQPFDICVASSLKSEFKKNLLAYQTTLDENGLLKNNKKLNMKEVRKMMLLCFLDAIYSSAKPSNIKSGFLNSGISPLNRDIPLSSKFAMKGGPDKIYEMGDKATINNMCLNQTKEMLAHVYKMDHHKVPSEEDFAFSISEIVKEVHDLHCQTSDCLALTKVPDLLMKSGNHYEMISIDE